MFFEKYINVLFSHCIICHVYFFFKIKIILDYNFSSFSSSYGINEIYIIT